MASKTKNKKKFSQKSSLVTKSNQRSQKRHTSPLKKLFKQKSKASNEKKKFLPSNVSITPSNIIGKYESTNAQQTLMGQHSIRSLRSKKGTKITHQCQLKLAKKNIPQHSQNPAISDYQEDKNLRFKSQLKIPNKNYRGSMLNTEISYEYGYPQLSYQNSNIQKRYSKSNQKYSDQSQIQRLFPKYSQKIERTSIEKDSTTKKQNFRTLSTDDKSQKKFGFTRKQKNRHKKQSSTNKIIEIKSPQCKRISNNKNKSVKPRNKNKISKTLLPDYFGCLSINKVESKIQKLKEKNQNSEAKKTKSSTNKTSRGNTNRNSRQKMQMTKVKQCQLGAMEVKSFCKAQTKKCISMKCLNNLKTIVLDQIKKYQEKAKIKTQRPSRQTSKKETKIK